MGERTRLTRGWALQASAKVARSGAEISLPSFRPRGWIPTKVPSTVLAALVARGICPDPTFGMNLRAIPGADYPRGENFSNLPFPADSPFAEPFWYRTVFHLPRRAKGKQIWLTFRGINYRAGVWINGALLASGDDLAGAIRIPEIDITDAVRPGHANALAVEVSAPDPEDLAITFMDWSPLPPDKVMGLWGAVDLRASGPVALRHPHVISRVDLPSRRRARLTITAELCNATDAPVHATLRARTLGARIAQPVDLAPRETREIELPALDVADPPLWWPAQMGRADLCDLYLAVEAFGAVSDTDHLRFGIREVSSELTDEGNRLFRVNGERILLRGAGYAPDLMLREDHRRLEDDVRYVRDLGLNAVRLEGKFPGDHFFDLADRHGILLLAGLPCCDAWERWDLWPDRNLAIATASVRDQVKRLRSRPSLLAWLNGSDYPPPPEIEQRYLDVLQKCRFSMPILSSASARESALTGPTGVKMTGPYEFVPPSYWLDERAPGGAFGFNTETSPGAAIPVVESLARFLPEASRWPIGDAFEFHAGGGMFQDIEIFQRALAARYGDPTGPEDFNLKAQLTAYEGIRAMFEAYGRNKYRSTGVIQWMLNNAWPSVIWHLYDFFLQPAGGYFGAKKACEPLHAQYGYGDRSISLVNSRYAAERGISVSVEALNLDLERRYARTIRVDAPADSSQNILDLPAIEGLSSTYFLRLTTDDARGARRSDNLYWLSTAPDTLDWEMSNWYFTPLATAADFTALARLPPADVEVKQRSGRRGREAHTRVSIENRSGAIAFFLRWQVVRGKEGAEVLPILYEDNYLSILPGEKRTLLATYRASDLRGAMPQVVVSGWNVAPRRAR